MGMSHPDFLCLLDHRLIGDALRRVSGQFDGDPLTVIRKELRHTGNGDCFQGELLDQISLVVDKVGYSKIQKGEISFHESQFELLAYPFDFGFDEIDFGLYDLPSELRPSVPKNCQSEKSGQGKTEKEAHPFLSNFFHARFPIECRWTNSWCNTRIHENLKSPLPGTISDSNRFFRLWVGSSSLQA